MNLARTILTVLDRYENLAVRETLILADVNLERPEPVTLSPLRRELASLEAAGQVASVQDEDRGTMYRITAQGRARLAA